MKVASGGALVTSGASSLGEAVARMLASHRPSFIFATATARLPKTWPSTLAASPILDT